MVIKAKPLRKCIACNEMKEKNSLIRISKYDGGISVDETGKSDGRGCYVCKTAECVRLAKKNRRIERAFSMKVPDEIYYRLERLVLDD